MNEKIVITSDEAFRAPTASSGASNPPPNAGAYYPPAAPAASGQSSALGILVVLLFVLLIALSATAAYIFSSSGNSRQAISNVLKRDRQLSSQIISLNSFSESENPDAFVDAVAASIKTYTQNANRFDVNSVPSDFAAAYRNNLRDWEKFGNVVARHPPFGTFASNFLEGFFRGLMGDVTGGAFAKQEAIDAWAQSVDAANAQVSESWREVEDAARKYGVDVP